MSNTYYIPLSMVADKAGFEFLSDLYDKILHIDNTDIYVNFDYCKEFEANLAAALGALLSYAISEKQCNVYVNNPREKGVRRALSRNKFLRAFEVLTQIEDRETFIEYSCFGVGETVKFKNFILTNLVQKKRFPHCSEKAADKIIESIYEIFANAVSHGGSKYVYCCGEMHARHGRSMMDMTFVNLGATVIENVNNYLKKREKSSLEPCNALIWAFQRGNTTKPIPGGLGLDILREFITLNEGRIQMVSGNAMLEIEKDETNSIVLDMYFPGTIVNVDFNCSDQKSYKLTEENTDLNNLL